MIVLFTKLCYGKNKTTENRTFPVSRLSTEFISKNSLVKKKNLAKLNIGRVALQMLAEKHVNIHIRLSLSFDFKET
jgi:hypothetical protein